jgi:hypothetical protein
MTHAEQHRMIIELTDFERRMGRDDQELFHMFVKRDKDDEDLDLIAGKKLAAMHEKYVVRRGRTL